MATWIAFHLTDRCQLDCQHCLRDPAKTPKDLPLDILRKTLTEARDFYGMAHVGLTGGEPTLHPEFPAVIDTIVELGFTWHMVTNARRFEHTIKLLKAVPSRRKALTAIDFSLDGADEKTHDTIRGKGSYREVMLGATICMAHEIPFILQMVVNAKNVHQIEDFGLLASNLRAKRASFGMMQPTGTHLDRELYLSPAQWKGAYERLLRLRAALKIEVVTAEGFPVEKPFHVCDPWKSEQLHVDVEGRLNLCCMHAGTPGSRRDVGGDLHEMPLADAHRRLLGVIHEAQSARLDELAKPATEWTDFACNGCLKHFGKPHWSGNGAAGPEAQRERWRGAWDKRQLRVVS
jgi:MoaA/NifB/PqqE/SkfB family radical SAM enzyme